MAIRGWSSFLLAALLGACASEQAPAPPQLTRLTTDRTYLRDQHGRYVSFNGINVAGSTKVPVSESPEGIPSYVGRPFDLARAQEHFGSLRAMGFNSVRLLVEWEGVEPVRRGQYDWDYLRSIRALVQAAGEQGLYVLVDMHQDAFSRHIGVRFNDKPAFGKPGSLENQLLALIPPYTDRVLGDGAPKWAVQACLQEKDLDSPNWGIPRVVSGLTDEALYDLYRLYTRLNTGAPAQEPASIEWIVYFLNHKPAPFAPNETSDVLPFTNWPVAQALSLDMARAFACLFAGDQVFPGLSREGKNVKDYLQDAYAAAWAQVAAQVRDLPNVMGYEVINEPVANFLLLSAGAAFVQGGLDGARGALEGLLGPETGGEVFEVLVGLRLLPPDSKPETLRLWGLDAVNVPAALGLNNGFDERFMKPFYERVGRAILAEDPAAVIFFESSISAASLLLGSPEGGIGGQWEAPMTRPDLPQVVYAPHWYPDIYPMPGFNQRPRDFSTTQWRWRDFQPALEKAHHLSTYSLSNIPVVFGEFGTYFNYGGIDWARSEDYLTSAWLLNSYYEAFERMFQSRMLWCWSPDNDYKLGDRWNREDFSIVDPALKPRAEAAWSRPFPKALAGKPLAMHFHSDLHWFDPDKGVVDPQREFQVRYGGKETGAPSEISVPEVQYPDGFYVWVSDGHCHYDAKTWTLYHYPSDDEPGAEHWVRLMPPLPGREATGWKYFFKGEQVVAR